MKEKITDNRELFHVLRKEVWEKFNEKKVDLRERVDFYIYSLLIAMSAAIKSSEYKKNHLHLMVHNIIEDIEAEASNAFLERKEK